MDANTLRTEFQTWRNEVVRARMTGTTPPEPSAHLAPHIAAFIEVDGLAASARMAARQAAGLSAQPQQVVQLVEAFRKAFRGEGLDPEEA